MSIKAKPAGEADGMTAKLGRVPGGTTLPGRCTVTGRVWLDCCMLLLLGVILLVGSRRLVVYHVVPMNMIDSTTPEDRDATSSTDGSLPGVGS